MEGIILGDFHLARGEYEDAIASYQRGLSADPGNTTLQEKLHAAMRACQKDNAVLSAGLNCGSVTPVVKLIPSGDFTRWNKPVTSGQIVPDNAIDGGLKPHGSLNLPPLENAPPRAFVIIMIGIDQNGNVIPGRKMSDDNRLAPQVMAAAKAWKFEPPTVNGTPVSTNIQVIVTF